MRISWIAALMAATALVPAIASAQDAPRDKDRGDARENRGDRGQRGQAGQPQARPAAQPAQQQQQRAQGGQRPDGGAGRGGYRGQGQLVGQQARPQLQQPQQGGPAYQRVDRGPDNRGQGDRGQDNRGQDNRGAQRFDGRGAGAGFQGNGGYRGDDRGRADYRDNGRGRQGYDQRGGGWDRGWRNNGQYNWSRYRNANRGAFHLPRYYAPSGWDYGYRRFGIGFTLSSILYDQDYWIDDPAYYRLPPAYGPYRWVRYYNDALLVDIRSGYVVDEIYDIFW